MKRRLLVSLAAIMTISALTACGSSNQNTLNIAKEGMFSSCEVLLLSLLQENMMKNPTGLILQELVIQHMLTMQMYCTKIQKMITEIL